MILNSWFKAYTPRQGGSYRIGTGDTMGVYPSRVGKSLPTAASPKGRSSVSESLRRCFIATIIYNVFFLVTIISSMMPIFI